MSTPRRTEERQHRRNASAPYSLSARPSKQAPVAETPSRGLSGIFSSLFSPFRSARKPVSEPDPEPEYQLEDEDEEQEDGQNDEQSLESEPHNVGQAPPSPTPLSRSNLYPNLSLTNLPTSKSMSSFPNGSHGFSTPRLRGNFAIPPSPSFTNRSGMGVGGGLSGGSVIGSDGTSPPSRATEELVKFFKEKEDQGNAPLTPIEQAGVFHLLQQAGATQNLPTAFTPNFKMGSPGPVASTSQVVPSTSLNSLFNSPSASVSQSSPFRRRRPIYVGAGYSSQGRKRRQTPLAGTDEGLKRSTSESSIFDISNGTSSSSSASGKRRRMDEEDAPSNVPLESGLGMRASSSTPNLASLTGSAPEHKPVASAIAKSAALNFPKIANTTPARPSPLWQVSKAATPSPSPPKKASSKPPTPTRAADLMLGIIEQENASATKVAREAVLNPYASSDSPVSRIPRSRPARVGTPRRGTAAPETAVAKPPAPEFSQLEMLERSMPLELRKDDGKRARITPSPAPASKASPAAPTPFSFAPSKTAPVAAAPSPPASAPTKQMAKGGPTSKSKLAPPAKKTEEIVIISSDEEDDDEDEEVDELEEEEEEDLLPVPTKTKKSSASPFATAPKKGSPVVETPSWAPPPPKAHQSNIRPAKVPSTLVAPSTPQPPTRKASLPPTHPPTFTFPPPPSTAPTSIPTSTPAPQTSEFTFTSPTPPTIVVTTPAPLTMDEARQRALTISRAALPKFSFESLNLPSSKEEDAVMRAVQNLVREMNRSELPTVVL